MNIAELFVKLGVKGESSLGKALKGVKKGMSETKEMSISTKAAVLGVVYGLERMMSNAAQTGTGLKQFANATGLAVKNLQVWQHAGRKFSVNASEITGAFSGIQMAMMNMIATGSQPAGMAVFANAMKIDPKRLTDTKYMMEQLQEYMQLVTASEARLIGQSFGFSDAMIGSMRKGAFSAKNMALARKQANIYSMSEINNLQRIESKWAQIGHNIKIAMGRLVADQGLEFVKPIENLSKAVVSLSEGLLGFLKATKALSGISYIFEGIADGLKGINRLIGPKKTPYRSEKSKKNLYGRRRKMDQKESFGVKAISTFLELFMPSGSKLNLLKSINTSGANAAIPRNNSMYMDRNKSVSNKYETKITINESKSPKETGGEVMKAFNRSIQSAGRIRDNGQDS